MTTRTPGAGGTNQATTLEAGLVAELRRIQLLERSQDCNPNGFNQVQSNQNDDTSTFTAQISFPVQITEDSEGKLVIAAIDYLVQPDGQPAYYSPGSGGTITATTIQGSVLQHTNLLKKLENDSTKNPTNANRISWTLESGVIGGIGNGNFRATYTDLPLETSLSDNGQQITIGKEYLL